MSKGLEAAKAGFTAAGGGVKGFSAALATTGLPLIIMGVQALISAFETFEPVADAVEDTINAISNGFKGLLGGGSMSGAIKAGQELTNVMRDLEDTAAGYSIAQEQANRQIRMLQIIASDRTKSEKERLKALEDADKVQKELYDADVARNKKLLDGQKAALIAQTGLKEFELEILATTSDAADANYQKILQRAEKELKIDKKKLEEYQKTLLEKEKLDTQNLVFEEQRVKLSNRIIERGEAQAEKAQAAREKAAETAKAAKEKADQAEAARLQKLEALEAEFQLSERERLNKSFEDKLKTIQGNGERETLLRLDIVAAQEAALKKFDEDAETKRQEKEAARLLKLITDAKAAQAILADNAKMELELQKLFSKSQNDIDEEFANSNYETFKEFYDAKKKLYADDVKALDEAAKEKIAIENAVFFAAQSIQGLFTNLANAAGEQTAAGIAFQKIAAGIQIAIDTAKSITAAVAGATTAAAAGGPAAPFLIVGYIASMVGSVIGAVTQATQLLSSAGEVPAPPRFATGVIGLDGAGTATSDSIDAKLSRGESVITAKATERFAPVLAQMELAVGNRPNFQLGNRKFATGYIPTTDGGYSDRAMSNEVNNASTMAKMVSDSIAKMPQPKLVYDEFTNFVNNRNQSVNLSEL
jgi:chemotaxis protein histidine kinase CheA